tara:strand:+ start:32768 stop:33553 length:786 start_codon:yes stop_codon:yes gene_type:complete
MQVLQLNTVKLQTHEKRLDVILDNPPVNALSKELITELNESLDWLENNDLFSLVVFSGEGKHFCAGADLKERQSMSDEEVASFVSSVCDTFQRVAEISAPTLAAINGTCFGGGLELALACDFRVMADQGFIGLKETSLGIIPGAGGTQRLPKLIGVSKAKYWIFSAQSFTPEEAFEDGVIDWLVTSDDLKTAVYEITKDIVCNAPLALKAAKRAINEGLDLPIRDGLKIENNNYKTIINTEDRREALKAFLDKRTPQWKGE